MAETHVKCCLQEPHGMPLPENFDLMSFSNRAFATDTRNQATKPRRAVEKVNDRKNELSCK